MKKLLFILGIIAVLAISTVAFAHGGRHQGNRMNNKGPAGCYGYSSQYGHHQMSGYHNNMGMNRMNHMGYRDMRGMRDQRNMNFRNDRSGMYGQRNEMYGQKNNMTGYRSNSRRYGFENRSQVNMPDNIKSKFEEVRDLRLKMRQSFSSSSPDKEELMSMHNKIQDLNSEIADWHFEQRIERFGN